MAQTHDGAMRVLARKAGVIVPCCVSCNSSKKNRDLDEWIATRPGPIKDELIGIIVMQDCWPV